MEIASLKAFVAVAETGSFSRAAETLFITQPAISKRVAALESDLGVPLFDRLGRGIQLTEAGTRFSISARRILSDLATSREEIRTLSSSISGRLRLATSHHIGIHRLPPVLKAFTQAHPGVDLDLLFMDSEEACKQVADGIIELAVVTLPERVEAQLITDLVWPDPLVIVCANEHPLAQTRRVSPSILADHAAVLPARGTVTRTILFDALSPFEVAVTTALETNYLETIKVMVSVGMGWSSLPRSMLDESVCEVPVEGLQMQRQLGSVRLRGRTLSRAAEAFTGLLSQR